MAKKKQNKKVSKIKRSAKIIFGVTLTVSVLFLAGYAVDFFAKKYSQKPSLKKFFLFDSSEKPAAGINSARLEKFSLESYQSFFETLKKTEQENRSIDRQREKKLLSIKRTRNKNKESAEKRDKIKISGEITGSSPAGLTYRIQVGSFKKSERARGFAEKLAEKGYEPHISEVHISGRGTVYRVRIGRYKELGKAQEIAEMLQKKENLSAFITSR